MKRCTECGLLILPQREKLHKTRHKYGFRRDRLEQIKARVAAQEELPVYTDPIEWHNEPVMVTWTRILAGRGFYDRSPKALLIDEIERISCVYPEFSFAEILGLALNGTELTDCSDTLIIRRLRKLKRI